MARCQGLGEGRVCEASVVCRKFSLYISVQKKQRATIRDLAWSLSSYSASPLSDQSGEGHFRHPIQRKIDCNYIHPVPRQLRHLTYIMREFYSARELSIIATNSKIFIRKLIQSTSIDNCERLAAIRKQTNTASE